MRRGQAHLRQALVVSVLCFVVVACGGSNPFESDSDNGQSVFDFSMIPMAPGKAATTEELNDVGTFVALIQALPISSSPDQLAPIASYKSGFSTIEDLANELGSIFTNCTIETVTTIEGNNIRQLTYQFRPDTQCQATLSGSQMNKAYRVGTKDDSSRAPQFAESVTTWNLSTPASSKISSIQVSLNSSGRSVNLRERGETSTQESQVTYSFVMRLKSGVVHSATMKVGSVAKTTKVTDQRSESSQVTDLRVGFNLDGVITTYQTMDDTNSAQNKSQRYTKVNGILQ